jgi:hypothetical protein
MTLIEGLQKLERFSRDLESAINGYNYTGYDKIVETNCTAIVNHLTGLRLAVETGILIDNFTQFIDYRYRKIYYTSELNLIFTKNNISYFDIQESNQWYIDNSADINQYLSDIQSWINVCQLRFENISSLMKDKFDRRFYNR